VKHGFKVFDADAHVIYPKDLWQRYLPERFRDRIGLRQPIEGWEAYNPVTVDGTWTQHDTSIYGRFQRFIDWTADDMIA
jgi:hypothetical protein